MIGMLNGRVESIDADSALIEVAGVGYEARMPASDLSTLHTGEEARLYTSLNVSQDAITLYGFLSAAAKRMFLQLQKASGIGPKVALSILSTLGTERLARAVADGDAAALASSPGLGKKGAQKIILELQGSIDLKRLDADSGAGATTDSGTSRVVEGLVSLGWRQQDAEQAVRKVCSAHDIQTPLNADDVPRALKLALSSLDRGR